MTPRLAAAIKELDAALEEEVQRRLELALKGEEPKRDELAGARVRRALMKHGKLRTVGGR